MARLQILELPSGSSDDRPPFVLVIDEAATGPDGELLIKASDFVVAREDIGACDVFLFEETVEIPANAPLPLPGIADDAERAGTTQLVYAHERTRLDLCDALLLSGDTTWRKLIEAVRERQRELAGLYRRLDDPDSPQPRAERDAAEARAKLAKSETARDKLRRDREFWEKAAAKNGELYAACENQRDEARRDRDEARQWARHGYEIGQRHCGWTDHGVAPAWLTEGWPPHFDSCEHLKRAADYDEALTRVLNLSTGPAHMDALHPDDSYRRGYRVAIGVAQRAARNEPTQTVEDRG